MLDKVVDCKISVLLNPFTNIEGFDAPLKRFYRFAYQTELTFDKSGHIAPGPFVEFEDLPDNLLLTLGMEIPRAWLVFSTHSIHDLDNIILQTTDTEDVVSEFELKHLLVEGNTE
jgi:UDP-glucose:glycoprotein glucosyltransferase